MNGMMKTTLNISQPLIKIKIIDDSKIELLFSSKKINKSKIIKRLYEIKTNLFYEEQNQKYDKKIQELKSHYNHFFIFQKSKESNKSFEETKKMCDGIIENEMKNYKETNPYFSEEKYKNRDYKINCKLIKFFDIFIDIYSIQILFYSIILPLETLLCYIISKIL